MLIGLDLDDTLYKERDYVASGRRAVLKELKIEDEELKIDSTSDFFDTLAAKLVARGVADWPVSRLVEVYRYHHPDLKPDEELNSLLQSLRLAGHHVVIITDGESRRQRAKIHALGLDKVVDNIYVSDDVGGDKLAGCGFEFALCDYPCAERVYIGDNPAKDFAYARAHGWQTVMLADSHGVNIHPASGGVPAKTVIFDLHEFLRTLCRSTC